MLTFIDYIDKNTNITVLRTEKTNEGIDLLELDKGLV